MLLADSTSWAVEGGQSLRSPLAKGLEGGGGGGGSLAMGQIREYKGPQSAFGPDAKKIKYNN